MSRSGYSDDIENWQLICWRGAVTSAIKGARGQKFLAELRDALDAMPSKRLIADELQKAGSYCALGVVGHQRGLPLESIDPYDSKQVSQTFNIANALAKEIVFVNDEGDWRYSGETPEQRWIRMRKWVTDNLHEVEQADG